MTGKERRKNGRLPAGWNEDRIRRILAHYENQTEEQALREDQKAFSRRTETVMKVPRRLVPAIRRMIALSRGG